MSLNSMCMAETLPDGEILEAFEELEEKNAVAMVEFGRLIHSAYHSGCLRQHARCIALYMMKYNCPFEEAKAVFADPLIYGQKLKEEALRYYGIFQATRAGDNIL